MSYAAVAEFTRRLGLQTPTTAQLTQAQEALDAAALEIDSWLGWDVNPPAGPLTTQQAALLSGVNIKRASEHWRLTPFGALGQGPALPAVLTARDGFYRYTRELAPLKHYDTTTGAGGWGIG